MFRFGIAHKIKVFEELVSGPHPPGVQDCLDSTVGRFEDGHVGFQAVQDQNIFLRQIGCGIKGSSGLAWDLGVAPGAARAGAKPANPIPAIKASMKKDCSALNRIGGLSNIPHDIAADDSCPISNFQGSSLF